VIIPHGGLHLQMPHYIVNPGNNAKSGERDMIAAKAAHV
jgi:hypothetical protein